MQKLNRPVHLAKATFETCITSVRDAALKARLVGIAAVVESASLEYDTYATRQALHKVLRNALVGGDITMTEMKKVYTDRMAKKGSPGRDIYEDIISAPAHGRCPLCGQRLVTTLDHHLPKAHYPALAVVPLNLVPSCGDCNKAKLAAIPLTAAEVSLNPYYDDVQDVSWLESEVIKVRPAALRFYVKYPCEIESLLQERLRHHFKTLELSALYATEAAEELLNIRHQLIDLRTAAGPTTVRAELEHRAASGAAARPNGWRAAAYRAWAQSDWFCDGGFAPL